jgi:hypothetical protein
MPGACGTTETESGGGDGDDGGGDGDEGAIDGDGSGGITDVAVASEAEVDGVVACDGIGVAASVAVGTVACTVPDCCGNSAVPEVANVRTVVDVDGALLRLSKAGKSTNCTCLLCAVTVTDFFGRTATGRIGGEVEGDDTLDVLGLETLADRRRATMGLALRWPVVGEAGTGDEEVQVGSANELSTLALLEFDESIVNGESEAIDVNLIARALGLELLGLVGGGVDELVAVEVVVDMTVVGVVFASGAVFGGVAKCNSVLVRRDDDESSIAAAAAHAMLIGMLNSPIVVAVGSAVTVAVVGSDAAWSMGAMLALAVVSCGLEALAIGDCSTRVAAGARDGTRAAVASTVHLAVVVSRVGFAAALVLGCCCFCKRAIFSRVISHAACWIASLLSRSILLIAIAARLRRM